MAAYRQQPLPVHRGKTGISSLKREFKVALRFKAGASLVLKHSGEDTLH